MKPTMPFAILCDVDGTLALFDRTTENPYNRDFSKDKISEPVRDVLVPLWQMGTRIILLSGRSDEFREVTKTWLQENGVIYDFLLMRKEKDFRKDTVIKEEIYNEDIKGNYQVRFVIDDRKQVKRMWVSKGLFVFDVNQTDEEF